MWLEKFWQILYLGMYYKWSQVLTNYSYFCVCMFLFSLFTSILICCHLHLSTSVCVCVCVFVTSTWLSCSQVCREFQRGNCARGETECRFAHPSDSPMIDTSDNTVTVCMDYIKSRCSREKCKYFHPPTHLQAKIKAAQHQANQTAVAAQAAATAAAMVRAQHYSLPTVPHAYTVVEQETSTHYYTCPCSNHTHLTKFLPVHSTQRSKSSWGLNRTIKIFYGAYIEYTFNLPIRT